MAKKSNKQKKNEYPQSTMSSVQTPLSNENPNQNHNTKKVSMGPNTQR